MCDENWRGTDSDMDARVEEREEADSDASKRDSTMTDSKSHRRVREQLKS